MNEMRNLTSDLHRPSADLGRRSAPVEPVASKPSLVASLGTALFFVLVAAVTPARSNPLPDEISWAVVDNSCPSPASRTIKCGSGGKLYVGDLSVVSGCRLRGSATETPRAYPSPATAGVPSPPYSLPPGDSPLKVAAPAANSRPSRWPGVGAKTLDAPSIAVIDWSNSHGYTVATTAAYVSGLPARLYPVDDPDLQELLGEGVGDAHVLAQLCNVLQEVEVDGMAPPAVVNMSFGRYSPDDPVSRPCDNNAVSCLVVKALTRLAHEHGVFPVAAAGNYGDALFPGVITEVVAAGMLNLAAFVDQGLTRGISETPGGVNALVPGNGICMPFSNADDSEELMPLPPGTSYSAAVLSGWYAFTRQYVAEPVAAVWTPMWSDQGCFQLVSDPTVPCNDAVTAIFAQIFGVATASCWGALLPAPHLTVSAPPDPESTDPLASLPSFDDWSSQHNLAPAPDTCVPCIDDDGQKLVAGQGANTLSVDISASASPLSAAGQKLRSLYLRAGDDFYLLLDEAQPGAVQKLSDLQNNVYNGLRVEDVTLQPGEQASIVSVICQETDCHFKSVPIFRAP